MDRPEVHIGKLNAKIAISDDESLLHPAVVDQLVERVMARLRDAERSRGIAHDNTRLGRSAATRPDLLR
jgi:hypothetical protein